MQAVGHTLSPRPSPCLGLRPGPLQPEARGDHPALKAGSSPEQCGVGIVLLALELCFVFCAWPGALRTFLPASLKQGSLRFRVTAALEQLSIPILLLGFLLHKEDGLYRCSVFN